jgi:hypothetical protein
MAVMGALLALTLLVLPAAAQGPTRPSGDREPVQHGAQPNPGEVRPGSRDGDAPSAAAGDLVPRPARRILGLPVSTALLLGGAPAAAGPTGRAEPLHGLTLSGEGAIRVSGTHRKNV